MLSLDFADAWTLRTSPNKKKNHEKGGKTCCFSETLDDPDTLALQERLDHIWIQGLFPNKVKVNPVGDDLDARTADGLFPSDHLGVFVRISLDNAP
ncbi:MAG: hypothetical protein IH927_09545 [Proteobacteria bacterium]|nr:hypothetical protein [Pseudomonadota bacterium]